VHWYHFSVDDVFQALCEINNCDLFSHPFFNFLNRCHNQFGVNVDLYLFYRQKINGEWKTLKDITDKHSQVFKSNPWLRFGPHALDYDSPPHTQSIEDQKKTFDLIYKEITRITGRESNTGLVRLHCFSECYELTEYFHKRGVDALYSTDKKVYSWRMNKNSIIELKKKHMVVYQGMKFYRTHLRVENLVDDNPKAIIEKIENIIKKVGFFSFVTHEYELSGFNGEKIIETTFQILKHLNNKPIQSR
jgi:hypothetical protein